MVNEKQISSSGLSNYSKLSPVKFLKSYIPIRKLFGYSFLAIVSGLAGFSFILIVNQIISEMASSVEIDKPYYLGLFTISIISFFISRRWLSGAIIHFSQKIYWSIRDDVIKLILNAPYLKLKNYKDEIYTVLTADVGNLTNASLMIINFISSLILIFSCFTYMAFLSINLFLISLVIIAIAVGIYLYNSRIGNDLFKDSREVETSFMIVFNSILDGAKEIVMNYKKGEDIYYKKVVDILKKGKQTNTKAFFSFLNTEIIGQLAFYMLITFILTYANTILDVTTGVSISFVFALLYLLGPMVNVMSSLPFMKRAIVSLNKMEHLKAELQSIQLDYIRDTSFNEKFRSLEIRNYKFSYQRGKFTVGPVNLTIKEQEIIFIFGGNGAGKTTFINTLLGIYELDSGEVFINGRKPDLDSSEVVKELFSVVFSDYFLFDELYGIESPESKKVDTLISMFDLSEKVTFIENKFSTIDLSTGQRKRLALIYSILEDKPIIVLDEWAADQDPHFREKFYTNILPYLKNIEGKTIIAITHDDKYYANCDKLFKVEYGRLHEVPLKSKIFSVDI